MAPHSLSDRELIFPSKKYIPLFSYLKSFQGSKGLKLTSLTRSHFRARLCWLLLWSWQPASECLEPVHVYCPFQCPSRGEKAQVEVFNFAGIQKVMSAYTLAASVCSLSVWGPKWPPVQILEFFICSIYSQQDVLNCVLQETHTPRLSVPSPLFLWLCDFGIRWNSRKP